MPWILWLVTLDPLTLLYIAPGLSLTLWARRRIRTAWKVASFQTDQTGAAIAKATLSDGGMSNVNVTCTDEAMTDHCDSWMSTVRLSSSVYHGHSLSALAIAAQESAFARMPHWSRLRSRILLAISLGSLIAWIVIGTGILYRWTEMADGGMAMFSAVAIASIATVPLEKFACRSAEATICRILPDDTKANVAMVLNANCWRAVAIPLSVRPMRIGPIVQPTGSPRPPSAEFV